MRKLASLNRKGLYFVAAKVFLRRGGWLHGVKEYLKIAKKK